MNDSRGHSLEAALAQDDAAEEGVVSEGEERFNRARAAVGVVLGPLLAAVVLALPMDGLTREAHSLAAILVWVVTWWICEPVPIPVTAVLGAALAVLLKVAPAKVAFAPFAEPTIFLFLGSFILARAMHLHGLDRRLAFRMLSLRWVGASPTRTLFAVGALGCVLSMWVSNTATAAMLLPIAIGIVQAHTGSKSPRGAGDYGTAMMLMIAYAVSVGGIGTPIGSPPNLIGITMIEKFTATKISFLQWMALCVPIMIVMYLVLYALLRFLHRTPPPAAHAERFADHARDELARLGRLSRGEMNVALAFGIAVALWLAPGAMSLMLGEKSDLLVAFSARVPESVAALIAAGLLFVLPVNWKKREFTITWRDASHIDWGTLLLFGGGLSLGSMMFESKLAEHIGTGLLAISHAHTAWGIAFASILIGIIVSEAASNTASANMIVPVMISLAQAAKVDPLPAAIGATLGASWGFMLPVSTPPNAIVYGSGMIPITKMIRAGILFDIAGAGLLWCGLRVLLPLVGIGGG